MGGQFRREPFRLPTAIPAQIGRPAWTEPRTARVRLRSPLGREKQALTSGRCNRQKHEDKRANTDYSSGPEDPRGTPVLIGDDILDPVDAGEPHRVKEHVSQKYVCGYPLVDWG